MRLITAPVRNHSPRPSFTVIDSVILHDTATLNVQSVINHFNNPASQASAHYTIDRDGAIYSHVSETQKAWHAGRSSMWGRDDLNVNSIGIELVDADDRVPYPRLQLIALVELTVDICMRRPEITLHRIVGHQHIAPGRKVDPGPDFDWRAYLNAVGAHLAGFAALGGSP